jgi:PEP-CTERM motif
MKLPAQWLSSAIVAIVVILFSSTRPAFADSYTIYDLGDDNAHGIYGIDSAGDVVIWGSSGCGGSSTCYVTYVNGVATSDNSIPPVLSYDDGTSCGSTPAGFNSSKEVCNNGWVGLGSLYNPNGDPNGVYAGSGSGLNFLGSGSADQVFLNSLGDFAWTDGQDDEMYVAIRNSPPVFEALDFSPKGDFVPAATTPEPAGLLLMATGLVGITVAVRRRANRYRDLSE